MPFIGILLMLTSLALGDDVASPESFNAEQKEHWAFQIPKRPALPKVKDPSWIRNPIDAFIASGHESVDYVHAPEAEKGALLRRVTFDLTGLPPTIDELDQFLRDKSVDAYEKVVDRLLASPQYGERWAQHWLDLAHYAESNGFELDAERPDAWRYRDWVINALNRDMPYNEFVKLQLAGDEVAPGNADALIATGFGRCGPREVVGGNVDPAVRRQSELTEVTGTVGSVFLGLTMACARCHDHKFDALPTTDYYRLQSFFAGAEFIDQSIASPQEQEVYEEAIKAIDAQIAPLKHKMGELEAPYREALKEKKEATLTEEETALLAIPEADRTPAQKKKATGLRDSLRIIWEDVLEAVSANPKDHAEREGLKQAIYTLEVGKPRPPAKAMALIEPKAEAPETFVFRRGDAKSIGPKVAPRPPGIVLASLPKDSFSENFSQTESTTGRRKALVEWLTRPDHPLTTRVIVNRLWMHHFGRGLVATPSDFGVRGEEPSNPQLLDWLATELIEQGWKLKPIHRLMVTSATYRQSSPLGSVDSPLRKQSVDDPANTLLWKMNRRRMEAESLRDAMLFASGEFNPKAGGPGVLVPIEKEVEDLIFTEAEVVQLWPVTPDVSEHGRRSIYLFRKRNVRYPMFDAFDAPDTQTACPERATSTHALQPLVMLNSDFAIGQAKALAGRLLEEVCECCFDPKVDLAYRLTLGRTPKDDEVVQARAFIESQAELLRERVLKGEQTLAMPTFLPEEMDVAVAAAWVDFALAMLNRNEFIYIP